MNRWHHWCSGMLLWLVMGCLGSSVYAADVTDVADSFEKNNPFDFRLRVTYEFLQTNAKIARERGTRPEQFFDYLPEFDVTRTRHAMTLLPSIGLGRDFEINVMIPIVFTDTFASKPTEQAASQGSTLLNDGIVAKPAMQSRHGPGLGDMGIGFRWALTNDHRDRSMGTWVIGAQWVLPTGVVWDPLDPKIAADQPGVGVGRGVHWLHVHMAMSKRIYYFEPYVKIWYRYGIVAEDTKAKLVDPNWKKFQLDKVAALRKSEEVARNAGNTKAAASYGKQASFREGLVARAPEQSLIPSHFGGLMLGTEIVFWEHVGRQQKLTLDVRVIGTGQFEGRNPTIFTDMLAAYRPAAERASLITDHEQFFTVGGMAALHFRVAKFGYIRLEGHIEHTFPYFLTFAKRGLDNDNNGFVNPNSDEVYPYHVRNIDGIGKRIRQLDTWSYRFQISAALTL